MSVASSGQRTADSSSFASSHISEKPLILGFSCRSLLSRLVWSSRHMRSRSTPVSVLMNLG